MATPLTLASEAALHGGYAFRPRPAAANENAVFLLPAYAIHHSAPGVIMLPLSDAEVTWRIMVLWRRGTPGGALKALLNALFTKATPS